MLIINPGCKIVITYYLLVHVLLISGKKYAGVDTFHWLESSFNENEEVQLYAIIPRQSYKLRNTFIINYSMWKSRKRVWTDLKNFTNNGMPSLEIVRSFQCYYSSRFPIKAELAYNEENEKLKK